MFLIFKTLVAIQLLFCTAYLNSGYHSPLEKYSDQWNNDYFSQANTAANAQYLNPDEIDAIHVLNLARLSPKLFAATVIEPLTRNGYSPELASLINTMNSIPTLKIIYPLEDICQLAKNQALLDADAGIVAIEKNIVSSRNKPGSINGCLNYGNSSDPVQLIISLLLDLNNDSKSSRYMCLGDFKYMGVSTQPVKKEGYYSVIKFGNTMVGKKVAMDNSNKKYSTFWGGEISFWENTTSYGYTSAGLGQEIYKDDNTRILEKMVIPWLMYFTNLYRKEHGLDTLKHDQCLSEAARFQTDYLFYESKKNHQFKLEHFQDSSSQWFKGKSPSDRAHSAGCEKYCGENALYTNILSIPAGDLNNRKKLNLAAQKIARDMVYVQWHNSKSHRENMLTNGYSCLGASVAIGKHFSDDSYINDKGEKTMINDNNTVNWIAFGIQVMSY